MNQNFSKTSNTGKLILGDTELSLTCNEFKTLQIKGIIDATNDAMCIFKVLHLTDNSMVVKRNLKEIEILNKIKKLTEELPMEETP